MPPKKSHRVTKAHRPLTSKSKPTDPSATTAEILSKTLASDMMPKVKTSKHAAVSNFGLANGSGPVYFWHPHQENGFLGQWYKCTWEHEGDTYASAEMWMMVKKARLFGDEDIAQAMLKTNDPKKNKALGRKVKGFDAKVWDEQKEQIVEEGNYLKFTASNKAQQLRAMLLATGDRELVEVSKFDRTWGIGFIAKDADVARDAWGENLLGKAIMRVRERIKKETTDGKLNEGAA